MAQRPVLVGAFVLGGLLLFAVGLFLIGDRRMLFTKSFEVYAEFAQLGGLQNGAIVRVAGLDAGEVETIHVPASPSAKFRVKFRVREDLRPLMRLDSVATIQNDGLVGNKFLQIESGTDQSPIVADRGTIQSREPFDLATMLDKMNDTIDLLTTTVTELKGGVNEALSALTATANDAQTLMTDLGSEVRAIAASSQKVTGDLQVIVAGVREGRGSIGRLVNDDTLYKKVTGIADQAEKAMTNLKDATEDAKSAIADFRGEKGPVKGIAGDLQQTLGSIRETFDDLAESSEALKRNFFFRGFFNSRGFFDLDDVSVEDYRKGALTAGDRSVLRVWVKSGVLFEKDESGLERLTEDGRLRLDAAMATFLRYPRDTPMVVEGYANGVTTADRFVASRVRGQLVRDYLQRKYTLDASYLGVMPMGTEAPDSPDNGKWDGVALAVFVQSKAR